jgi:RNA polymerase sigma-70 factor (ECF subfamily)
MAETDGASTSPTLLRQLWNPGNNEQAWRTFLERYGPLIYRWCRRAGLRAADAEEVRDRVCYQLARAMRTFAYDPARRFRSWLKTVVDNAVRSLWRELRRPGALASGHAADQHDLEQIPAPADVDGLVQELDDGLAAELQRAQRVADGVRARVEDHTWQAFWLTAIGERPAPEVAAQLGMTTAAVYVAKNRVGKMLRQQAARVREETCPGSEADDHQLPG